MWCHLTYLDTGKPLATRRAYTTKVRTRSQRTYPNLQQPTRYIAPSPTTSSSPIQRPLCRSQSLHSQPDHIVQRRAFWHVIRYLQLPPKALTALSSQSEVIVRVRQLEFLLDISYVVYKALVFLKSTMEPAIWRIVDYQSCCQQGDLTSTLHGAGPSTRLVRCRRRKTHRRASRHFQHRFQDYAVW